MDESLKVILSYPVISKILILQLVSIDGYDRISQDKSGYKTGINSQMGWLGGVGQYCRGDRGMGSKATTLVFDAEAAWRTCNDHSRPARLKLASV